MISIKIGSWTNKQSVAYLYKNDGYGYILNLTQGKTPEAALKAAAKELKRLAKEAETMAKEL